MVDVSDKIYLKAFPLKSCFGSSFLTFDIALYLLQAPFGFIFQFPAIYVVLLIINKLTETHGNKPFVSTEASIKIN